MDIPSEILDDLRSSLESAVKRNPADAILLSGGLDTSIIATIAASYSRPKAYTVALRDAPAPDIEYAQLIAQRIGLKQELHLFSLEAYMENLPEVVKTLRVFDPMEIRNSAAIYIAMKQAKKDDVSSFLTGDACDELFAGYSYLFNLDPPTLKVSLQNLWNIMSFSAIPLAKSLGMEAKIPFLDPDFKKLAMQVDPALLVVEEHGRKWGKWVMRRAFEGQLPNEITWRIKTPIEYGCGTTMLPSILEQKIPDADFHEKRDRFKREDRVTIRDKEHLTYYEVFRDIFGMSKEDANEKRQCPQCRYSVMEHATFCRTCGAYPI